MNRPQQKKRDVPVEIRTPADRRAANNDRRPAPSHNYRYGAPPPGKKEIKSKVDCRREPAPGDKKGDGKKKADGEKDIKDIFAGQDHELAQMLQKDLVKGSPGITWDDIAGLEEAKRVLEEAVVWPLWKPNMFKGIRRPPKGVLLFGPPGTGKTLLAKAVATECQTTFFSVSASSLASKYRGESERMVKILFQMARYFAPSTIFIDEIDSLCGSRGGEGEHEASRRVKTEFLVQIDGCNSGGEDGEPAPYVMVLAATNYPWELDEALRRRMEKRIFIDLPEHDQRKKLIEIQLEGLPTELDSSALSTKMEGYSGDDIRAVCHDASMNGMRPVMAGKSKDEIIAMETAAVSPPVTARDFEEALRRIRPSVSKEDVIRHMEWKDEFGSA